MTEIPAGLIDLVRQGQVVLVLGAGASYGAEGPDGFRAPSGAELADLISDKFLGGHYKDRDLSLIAELAISERDSSTVQQFIVDLLHPLEPADFHKLIPTFRWHGIATTNYDRIVEKSYEREGQRVQKMACFISDEDRVEDKVRSPNHVLMIKLHGCITRAGDSRLPLILTPDQYISHRDHRHHLFDMLCQWGREKTLLFVGQDLSDFDIRSLLLTVQQRAGSSCPRYFLVRPAMEKPERTLWARRKIDVIDASFEEFLQDLDRAIPRSIRPLLSAIQPDHPIERHFTENTGMSPTLVDALNSNLEYVHPGDPSPIR